MPTTSVKISDVFRPGDISRLTLVNYIHVHITSSDIAASFKKEYRMQHILSIPRIQAKKIVMVLVRFMFCG